MGLYDHILRNDARYQAARHVGDGRGDPWASGFRRRLSVEPAKADRIMLRVAICCAVAAPFCIFLLEQVR